MIELRDGTVIMKDDVKSVFDAVETLVRKLSIAYIYIHQFVRPKSKKMRDDLVIFIIVRQAKSIALRKIR